MYPAAFEYHAPTSVKDALKLLGKLKDSKLLAGGHSLIPMMKLRLAQPKHIIDLGKVKGLGGVKEEKGVFSVGAMTTHWEVESNKALKAKVPVVSETAAVIGDPAVRDKSGVCKKVGVGVTGAGTKAVRAKGVEAALLNKKLDAATIEAAAQKAADGVDVQADLQGSVEYKAHLCRVFARRALEAALKRAQG